MNSVLREKTLSISNFNAAVEEFLRRWGELQEGERIELPWKVAQIPVKIYRDKEVRAYRHNG